MKIVIVGGGSYCWTPTLFRDIQFRAGRSAEALPFLKEVLAGNPAQPEIKAEALFLTQDINMVNANAQKAR